MPDPEPIQAAIFDLGQVVIGTDMEAIPRAWAREAGAPFEELKRKFVADTTYQLLERGEITFREYYESILGVLGCDIPFDAFRTGWNSIFRGLMPGIDALLTQLATKLRLIALTNTNDVHATEWYALYPQAPGYFERVFLSHEMRTRKPEPECFRQVLSHLELHPPAVVFIDDVAANVRAAEGLGLRGIVATGTQSVIEELRALGVGADILERPDQPLPDRRG